VRERRIDKENGMIITEVLSPGSASTITAAAGVITALGLLIAAALAVPLLRNTKRNNAQLHIIHTLVNSTLTTALQSELDGTKREEMLLRELIRMRSESELEPTDEQKAALSAIRRRIQDLTLAMQDRARQTRAADVQIENERIRQAG
jgi:hypothetical protein